MDCLGEPRPSQHRQLPLQCSLAADHLWLRIAELAQERPDWLPVLDAACAEAEEAEAYGGRFAGRRVLQHLQQTTGRREWRPGLRLLVGYGLLEKAGESTRGGRRAYYRMPHWREVKKMLGRLAHESRH